MQISSTTDSLTFKATIINTPQMDKYFRYVKSHATNKKPYHNTRENLILMNKIVKAFKQHPSQCQIEPRVYLRKGELFNVRGILDGRNRIVDVEPARSDSGTAPIENIFRKILDPQNKKVLNRLFGDEYMTQTDVWHDKYIMPIWEKINTTFREPTISISEEKLNKTFVQANLPNKDSKNIFKSIWDKLTK